MGLFSSKKKRTVYTSVARAVDDDMLPDTMRQSVIKAILEDSNISEGLVNGLLAGPGINFERMYRYGRDTYALGLPNASIMTNTGGTEDVEKILKGLLGDDITLEYCLLGAPRSQHFAWQKLTEDYGYDTASNTFSGLSQDLGTTVYLKDFVLLYTSATIENADPDTLAPLGVPATSGKTQVRQLSGMNGLGQYSNQSQYAEDPTRGTDGVGVSYTYTLDGEDHDGYFEFGLEMDDAAEYFQALVSWKSGDGLAYHYWSYRKGTGTYPTLDDDSKLSYENPGNYFPFVYFRHNRESRTKEKYRNTDEYLTSEKLLDYIGINYQDMADAIAENDDVGDIDQAYLMMGVPVNSEDATDLEYLIDFFDRLYRTNPSADNGGRDSGHGERKPGNAFLLEDADSNIILSYDSITKRTVAGKIGAPGKVWGGTNRNATTHTVSYVSGSSKNGPRYSTRQYTTYQYYRLFRRQIDESYYEEIKVWNLESNYRSDGSSYATNATLGDDPENILIPIDHDLAATYALGKREALYMRSLHYVFHAMHVERVKWYQSGLFSFVLTAAAIVIAVYTMQPQFAAIAAATTLAGAALIITTIIVKALVFNYVSKQVIKQLGMENTLLAAVVLAAVAAYAGYTDSQLLPSAGQLMAVSTNLANGVKTEAARLVGEYQDDLQDFQLYQEQANEALEEAQSLLDTNGLIDPDTFVRDQPLFVAGESPDSFYQRTIHSGNIGVMGIDAVSSYVDISLTLPDPSRTLGGAYG